MGTREINDVIEYEKDHNKFLSSKNNDIWIQGDGEPIAISSFKDISHLQACIKTVRRVRESFKKNRPQEVYDYFKLKLDEIEENLLKRYKKLTDI